MDISQIQQLVTICISAITMVLVIINFFYQRKRIKDLQDKLIERDSFVQLVKDINEMKNVSDLKEHVALKTENFEIKLAKLSSENKDLKKFILTLKEEKENSNKILRYFDINELIDFVSKQMNEMQNMASYPSNLTASVMLDFYAGLLDNITTQIKLKQNSK